MAARVPNGLSFGRVIAGVLERPPQDDRLVRLGGLGMPQMIAGDGLRNTIPLDELERFLDGDGCDRSVCRAQRAEDAANKVTGRERPGGVVKHNVLSLDLVESREDRLPATPTHRDEVRAGAERWKLLAGTPGNYDRPARGRAEHVEGPRDEGATT